jgi:hypothetical protein
VSESNTSNSLPTEPVVEWRGAVESFFANEWEELRSLILELEAVQWDEPKTSASETPTSEPEENTSEKTAIEPTATNGQTILDRSDGQPVSFAAWNDPDAEPAATGDLERQGRLAELAQDLERRLQSTDSSPTTPSI